MKKETAKYSVIVILIILLIIFSFLLIKKNYSKVNMATTNSVLSENEIYQEVYTEVLYGKENYVTHDENGNRVNTSDKMKEKVKVTGEEKLEIQGIEITSKDNNTIVSGTVKNTGNTLLGDEIITISLNDDTGDEILAIRVYIDEVSAGETTTFETIATLDLANAYNYTANK